MAPCVLSALALALDRSGWQAASDAGHVTALHPRARSCSVAVMALPRKPKPVPKSEPRREPKPMALGEIQARPTPLPMVASPLPPPLVKVDDVARHVRASPATIVRLVADGTLSTDNGAVVRVGKLLRFDLERVLAALKKPKSAA